MRNPVPQPTLPSLNIDEFSPAVRPVPKSNYASSLATSTKYDGYGTGYSEYPPDLNGAAPDYPPPMPLYDQYAHPSQFNNQYDQNSMYPPSDRQPASEFANSSTQLVKAGDSDPNVNHYYGEGVGIGGHRRGPSAGSQLYGHTLHAETEKRTSAYSNSSAGLAYDVPEQPTTPHRRTASGAYAAQVRQRDEDVILQQQAQEGFSYQQQWPGYGPDQYGREQYSQQGHASQRSKGGHDDYGPPHAL